MSKKGDPDLVAETVRAPREGGGKKKTNESKKIELDKSLPTKREQAILGGSGTSGGKKRQERGDLGRPNTKTIQFRRHRDGGGGDAETSSHLVRKTRR